MIRRLYSFLVRRHPAHFRERFGEQLLSTFDDSIRERGTLRLLLDAVVSLARQRLFRPDNVSGRLQRRAKVMNMAWVFSVVPIQIGVAFAISPVIQTVGATMFYILLPAFIILSFLYGRRSCEGGFVSIKIDPLSARRELERKRNTFQLWAHSMGRLLAIGVSIWAAPVAIASLFAGTLALRSWATVNALVFAIQTVTYFVVLKRVNERAVVALQQEIDRSSPTARS